MGKNGNVAFLILPILKRFKAKRAQETKYQEITKFSFKMFKIMRFFRSPKCSKTIVQLTFTTQKPNACSLLDWFLYPFWVNLAQKLKIVRLS